ncbi:MAG: AAA family ATPase [Kiritimatiellae bacterium]|nr:AAA family ATPase [Kiritimatiellia bacterium]
MTYIDYIEIANFKGLGERVHVDLGNPSVLIGPNNAGKTTVLQALSLWGRAVRAWLEKKGSGHMKGKRDGVGINRLLIMDIPVRETRYFWNGTRLRIGNNPIVFSICVGVRMPGGITKPLCMEFTYRDSESLYAKPSDEHYGDQELLEASKRIEFNLLYPMSGLASGVSETTEETRLPDGRVNVLLGQGQTAQVLRNLCYKVRENSKEDWCRICDIMERMFRYRFGDPTFDEARGTLSLVYRQIGLDHDLELVLAGRGVQQMLLILSYLYSHKGGVLMIDEPDAHLEILRQKQVFVILKDVSEETRCQVVIATHSEVILDEAIDTNLTSIVNGISANLSTQSDIKTTLKNLGVEHYYNAQVARRLLIVEGSTDVEMLRAFAKKINHPVKDILEGPIFTFYTQNVNPKETSGDRIERMAIEGLDFRKYAMTLKHLVPDLRVIAVLDSDGSKKRADEVLNDDFKIVRWKKYELENYFITPERLSEFIKQLVGGQEGELFAVSEQCAEDIANAIDKALSEYVFDGDMTKVHEYHEASVTIKNKLLSDVKASGFAETVFEEFARLRGSPVLLNKGSYCMMISLLTPDEVPVEVREKLDVIYEMLKK